jgi:3-oxoacyl-[acyl-carrier protein] reductase
MIKPMSDRVQEGRTVLVTGAAQGIGKAVSEAFLENGDTVVLTDRDGERLAATAQELDPSGERARPVLLDVSDLDMLASVVEEVERSHGGVDVLVNNAGITHVRSLWDLTPEEWEEVLAVNLRPVFFLSRLAARGMIDRGWGRIVNLTSVAGLAPRPSGAHYGVSKAGVVSVTRAFALELAPHGTTVNAVAPGLIETAMSNLMPPERKAQRIAESIPVRRSAGPEEVAWLIRYLASDAASFITGATIDINGGVIMR